MEENSQLHSESNRQEAFQEGTPRPDDGTDNLGEYEKARKLWKLYLEGQISATELNERLTPKDVKVVDMYNKLKDMFEAKDV